MNTSEQQRQFSHLTKDIDQRLGFMVFSEMGNFSTESDARVLRFLLTRLENWIQETLEVVGREGK